MIIICVISIYGINNDFAKSFVNKYYLSIKISSFYSIFCIIGHIVIIDINNKVFLPTDLIYTMNKFFFHMSKQEMECLYSNYDKHTIKY